MPKAQREEKHQRAIDATRVYLIDLLQSERYCEAQQVGKALEQLVFSLARGGGLATALTATTPHPC